MPTRALLALEDLCNSTSALLLIMLHHDLLVLQPYRVVLQHGPSSPSRRNHCTGRRLVLEDVEADIPDFLQMLVRRLADRTEMVTVVAAKIQLGLCPVALSSQLWDMTGCLACSRICCPGPCSLPFHIGWHHVTESGSYICAAVPAPPPAAYDTGH